MSLTISIPDDFAAVLGASPEERERRAREALALELYREGKISLRRMGELAGVGGDYWAAENFRIQHKAPLNYSIEDLEADRKAAERFLDK
jgi:predicted HTH domain antitoxin